MCNRCKRRGLDCEGPKELTFINHTTRPVAKPIFAGIQTITYNPPQQLSPLAFQEDICLAYTRKVMLKGGPVELACNLAFSSGPGMEESPGLQLLRDSIMALSTTFFGSQHNQKTLQTKGYSRYGAVLAQLNTHLATPELQTDDLTILGALICVLLETFLPTGPLNFLKHLRGIETILEVRGVPQQPMSRTTIVLFHGLRTLSILGGLVSRPFLKK